MVDIEPFRGLIVGSEIVCGKVVACPAGKIWLVRGEGLVADSLALNSVRG